ncbi:DUF998 domain-containing protein [Candidatus Enterococcus clewellii]|uniref:DUF998 domain-containing protein n=1 Tax=Candidatus Enterococcus clewellii TaxID=1834193 RepID=A0AAQ3VT27_9ENTE
MTFLKKYGFYFMVLAILSELILPFILGSFYLNYDSFTMLISSFGEDGSPVKLAFKIWVSINGVLFLLAIPSFYQRFKQTSRPLAKWLSIMIAAFGIGDCIITGLFDQSTNHSEIDIEGMIHNYASGIGFVALLIGTALLFRLYSLENKHFMVTIIPIIFIISLLFMLLFALPKIPILNQVHVPYRGLWQRGNLLFLYLPFLFVALEGLFTRIENR